MPLPKAEYEKAMGRKMTDAEYNKITAGAGPQSRDAAAYEGAKLLESKDKSGIKYPVARPMRATAPGVAPLSFTEQNPAYGAQPAVVGIAQPMTILERDRAEQGGMLYKPPVVAPQYAMGMSIEQTPEEFRNEVPAVVDDPWGPDAPNIVANYNAPSPTPEQVYAMAFGEDDDPTKKKKK